MRVVGCRRLVVGLLLAACLYLVAPLTGSAQTDGVQPVDQGSSWSDAQRAGFYKQDQGSRLIPFAWLAALTQADGTPFIASLARYGYLPDPDPANASGLPLGFVKAASSYGAVVGMTCAACHVREIVSNNVAYRIDGAPSLADTGAFLGDVDGAVQRVLATDAAFTRFAQSVLGTVASDATARDVLKVDVRYWATRFHTLVSGSLPQDHPWGPARFDAFAMAFNAIGGLSVGPPPAYLSPDNVQPADAPVRSPVLWDSGKQDRAQWTGIAQSGTPPLALARSLAELYGTFGQVRPVLTPGALGPLDRDYLLHSSVSFRGLETLDDLVDRMGAPVWPWPIDRALADKGKTIFARSPADGGCAACHGETPGALPGTWKTPVVDAGTDRRACKALFRSVETKSLAGASVPGSLEPLLARDQALNVLRVIVAGAILDRDAEVALKRPLATLIDRVFTSPQAPIVLAAPPVENGYEARVLHGIWSAAPYLHDGSVPTLADLLEPADQRPKSFAIGQTYDPAKIGLAAQQSPQSFTFKATGCDDLNSGASNCGHAYGTQLSSEDKRALLEYLKTL